MDDEDTWDELASEVKRVVESSAKAVAEAMRNMEERHAETQVPVKPQSMHKCIEKKVPWTRRDQLLVRWLVADSSYKK